MGGVFEDVTLTWKGETYVIKSNRVMGAIARAEQHITLKELYQSAARDDVRITSVVAAFASVLRYAGAKVEDEEVYAGMFAAEAQANVYGAVEGLMSLMVPPNLRTKSDEKVPAKVDEKQKDDILGNLNRRTRRAAQSSSKKLSKRPIVGE